jgi:putative ABC transport system permease protein
MLANEKMRQGMSAQEAQRAAHMELGGIEQLKEEVRAARPGVWLGILWQDIHFSARVLRKNPSFTAIIVLVLALGIGATTGIFGLIEAVLLRPVPAPSAERLLALYTSGPHGIGYSSTSYPDYEYYSNQTRMFSDVAAYARIELAWNLGGPTGLTWAELVSDNYFSVLGVVPVLGRTFSESHDHSGVPDSDVVLSYRFWRDEAASDPNIVGKIFYINERAFTIIGVAPLGFEGVNLDWGAPPDFWVPIKLQTEMMPGSPDLLHKAEARWLLMIGRLADGASLKQARAEAGVLASQLAIQYRGVDDGRTVILLPSADARFWPAYRAGITQFLLVLMIAAGLVLVVGCFNAASLLLARASARGREISTRLALGASRGRIVRQLLTESILLAIGGAGCGLLLALFIITWLPHFRLPFHIPVALDLRLDKSAFAFAAVLAIGSTLLFALAPALQTSRLDIITALKEKGEGSLTGAAGRSTRSLLIVAQIALTATSLTGAGLLLSSLHKMQTANVGFDPNDVLALTVHLPRDRYTVPQQVQFSTQLLDRVSQLTGVESASLTEDLPMSFVRSTRGILVPEANFVAPKEGFPVDSGEVGPEYFETLRIPVLQGREFSAEDGGSAPGVAIVNGTMARSFWPNESAVGKHIRVVGESSDREVLGVVADAKYHNIAENPAAYLYLPELQDQSEMPDPQLVIRTRGTPMGLARAVENEVAELDPRVPVSNVETLDQQIMDSLSQPRMAAALVSLFAVLALVLAAAGIFGTMAYVVTQRTREFGVRMALGADSLDIVSLVGWQAARIVLLGLVLGLAGAFGLMRYIDSLLYNVRSADPATFAAVAGLVIGAAALACYFPARRATHIDPMVALRHE